MDIYKTKKYSDNWSTPKEIYDYFMSAGFFDPCPLDDNGIDALFIDWKDKNFVNPPYSNVEKFVDKAISCSFSGAISVLLVPVRSDSKWFQKMLGYCSCLYLIKGRLKFGDAEKSAPFPSCFAVISFDPYGRLALKHGSITNFFDYFNINYLHLY